MPEIIFAENPKGQHGEFTSSALSADEQSLVEAVVNWENFDVCNRRIHTVYGRSIVLASPSRTSLNGDGEDVLRGDYSGLQLIGAGGSKQFIYSGIRVCPEQTLISPVDPEDHSKELAEILQLRRINEQGRLEFWYRPYAPLHGMDQRESQARKTYTLQLGDSLAPFHKEGKVTPFVVPSFAAEGFFPELLDPEGNPLRFQVYRVPLEKRLPGQFVEIASKFGLDAAQYILEESARYTGLTLRFFHESGLAYMDGHLGNTSFFATEMGKTLYVTDLGSIMDISNHRFMDRYRGFDLRMYLESTKEMINYVAPWCFKNNLTDLSPDQFSGMLFAHVLSMLVTGYFSPQLRELSDGNGKPGLNERQFGELLIARSRELSIAALKRRSSQAFIEYFEGFYRAFPNSYDP